MQNIIDSLLFRVINIFNVIPKDLDRLKSINLIDFFINGIVSFSVFYFISRFFRAYLIRLALFLTGSYLLYRVLARSSFIYGVDLYASLGLMLPHLDIPNLTYLIVKEKVLYVYDILRESILFLITPFLKIYEFILKLIYLYKEKKEFREYQKANQEYKETNKESYQEEDSYTENENIDEEDIKSDETKDNYEQKSEYKKDDYKEEKKSIWESNNAYEILGVSTNATKSEIKKAYRKLSKIYHPDLTTDKKAEYTKIFQKINWAYNILK